MANLMTEVLNSVKWGEEECYLKEFTDKYNLPQVAKITKGQCSNVGVPSFTNPSANNVILVAQIAKKLKVAAQCVKFKDNRVVPVGTKLSIPDSYDGWFEILSEEGRAVRCIESVRELLAVFPETCLVRENIKAHVPKLDNLETISDKTRTLRAGETLVLLSEVHVASTRSKSGRYLRCFTKTGDTVFLSADIKGKFSPIAGESNISGVHKIANLVSKRFPLMVRLVHGTPPFRIKNSFHFLKEMRLYTLYEEESIMAVPIQKDTHIVALPPSAHLKVQVPREGLMRAKNYALLVDTCKSLVQDYCSKIHRFDISLATELRGPKVDPKMAEKNGSRIIQIKRSISDPISKCKSRDALFDEIFPNDWTDDTPYDEIDDIYDYVRGFAPLPPKVIFSSQNITNGNIPRSPNQSLTPSSSATPNSSKSSGTLDNRPEPPPIETIPVRRGSKDEIRLFNTGMICAISESSGESDVEGHIYEKVDNMRLKYTPTITDEKFFIPPSINNGVNKYLKKSSTQQRIQQKTKYFKNSKSPSAFRDMPIQRACQRQKNSLSKSLLTSQLFNIRYKSLTNLGSLDFDTLDSSNSGGDNSRVSGGSQEQQRRSKLQRPKSLTDLYSDRVNNLSSYKHSDKIPHGMDNRNLYFCHEVDNAKYINAHRSKRIGTLYL